MTLVRVAMDPEKNRKGKMLRKIHKICEHIQYHDAVQKMVPGKKGTYPDHSKLKCLECPGWEMSDYGMVRRGCYAIALEYVNILKYGNPWGKKYRNSRKNWPRLTPKDMRVKDVRRTKRSK